MLRSALLAFGILSVAPAVAQTQAPDTAPIASDNDAWRAAALAPITVKIDTGQQAEPVRVTATIDRAALPTALSLLQNHGVLSRDISKADFDKRPAFYANAIALRLVSWAVQDAYQNNPDLAASRWKVLLTSPGNTVNTPAQEVFSFGFDRSSLAAANLPSLPFTAFPTKAPGFSYNLRFTWDMARETSGSIDDD